MARQPNYASMDRRTTAYKNERAAYERRNKNYRKQMRAAKKAGQTAAEAGIG